MVDGVAAVGGSGGLQDLAGHQALERLGLDADGLGAEVRERVGGAGEEEVAGEDGDRVAPAGVGAGDAAPDVGLVHDVVVVERGEVGQLDDHGGGHDAGRVGVSELGGEHHEQRAEALPAGQDEVLRGLRDEGDVALGGVQETRLHGRQTGLDIGLKSLVPHAEAERPDDGHEGVSCLLTPAVDHTVGSDHTGRSRGLSMCRWIHSSQRIRSPFDHRGRLPVTPGMFVIRRYEQE